MAQDAQAAAAWPGDGGVGGGGALPGSLDSEGLFPGYYTQQRPPSHLEMLARPTNEQGQEQQTGGASAEQEAAASQPSGGAGSQDEQGSEEAVGQEQQASQEGGSGCQAAAQRTGDDTARKDDWVEAADADLPPWALRQQPAALAQPGSLLAGREQLAALPGTPRQLVFAIRAALEQRGNPATRAVAPSTLLPPGQNNTQYLGLSQDMWASQVIQAQADQEEMLLHVGADAGDGYYLFRCKVQEQLDKLWALTEQLASQLEQGTAAVALQRADEQGGAHAFEAEVLQLREALRKSQQKLAAALTDNKQLVATLQDKEEKVKAADLEAEHLSAAVGRLEQANAAAAEREAELQQQLEQATATAAEREAELQQQLEQAGEEAAVREATLQRQQQAAVAAAEREAALQQQLEQASEALVVHQATLQRQQQAAIAAAEREAALQQQLEQAGEEAAVREATLQRQQQVAVAAAEREAALQQQLEQASEAAAEREAELQQEVEQAQRQAGEQGEESRQLRRQLAELQRTRQQELADAEEQQEAAAAQHRRLADKTRRWKARCQAAEEQAAQRAAASKGAGQMAAERDAAVAECHRLQQQNAALQVASAEVLAQVQQVAAAAEAHAQEAQAAAHAWHTPTPAAPVPEPQVACDELSHEQLCELKRFLTDTNYQHTKLGGAYQPMRALRNIDFWAGVAEGVQAPLWLVQKEGFRMLTEKALAGQRAAEAAAAEARRCEKVALQQARRMKAAVAEVQRVTAAQQPTCSSAGSSGGQQRGGERRREAQGAHDMVWELLVELGQRDDELLEAQRELELEREASSCTAWQLVLEAQEAHERACQRMRQLEAQLAESQEYVQRLQEAVAQLRQAGEERAAKPARCDQAGAAELAGGQALAATSESWEDPPAGNEAAPAAAAARGMTQPAEQRGWRDEGAESLAGATASSQLQLAEPGEYVEQPGQLEGEPAAAAAQVEQDERLDATALPAAGSQAALAPAAASSHMGAGLQGGLKQPADWQHFMTPELVKEHGAFASLMAQAIAMQSTSGGGRGGGRGSRKRGREAAA